MEKSSIAWDTFFLRKIFESTQRGKRLKKSDQHPGSTAYISSTALNNGVDAFIGNTKNVRKFKHCLTVANSGSVGATFFHPYEFVASDHVTSLENQQFSSYVYLFIANQVNRLSEKYNFNREINDQRISREKIMLPTTDNGSPDFLKMETKVARIFQCKKQNYIRYIEKVLAQLESKAVPNLNQKEWRAFKIRDIFETDKGIYLNKKDVINGSKPYITATSSNNGISDFIGNDALFQGGSITIEKISLSSFYQPTSYYCSHDVSVLSNSNLNKFNSLFICTMLKRQGAKYSYGRQAQLKVVQREVVYLPINDEQLPDFEYMTQYAKNMYIAKIQQYLSFTKLNMMK